MLKHDCSQQCLEKCLHYAREVYASGIFLRYYDGGHILTYINNQKHLTKFTFFTINNKQPI